MTKKERNQVRRKLEAAGYACSGVGCEDGNGRMINRGLSIEGKGVNKIIWDAEAASELLS